MTVLLVANVTWFVRQVTTLIHEIWTALPVEVTATAEAYPGRALISLGVLILVVIRLVMLSGGSVAIIAARLLLAGAGLLLLLELEVLMIGLGSITSMQPGSRREPLLTQ